MTDQPVDLIARALLYEGYLLYPYRHSALKNRQRFNFGVLLPERFCAQGSGDRWRMQAECPVRGAAETHVDVSVRFLQLVEQIDPSGNRWHEALEREVHCGAGTVDDVVQAPRRVEFRFPAPGADPAGHHPPVVHGELSVQASVIRPGAYKLTVHVANLRQVAREAARDDALVHSLVSAHAVIRVADGELVSLLDPPDGWQDVAAACVNDGVWPVLVGADGSRTCMLASPIILYDYPQIAPESAGDLFDGTEIDEILALRILTMTDEEKRDARASDARAREILDRTDGLSPEHWSRLHGAVRGLRKIGEEPS